MEANQDAQDLQKVRAESETEQVNQTPPGSVVSANRTAGQELHRRQLMVRSILQSNSNTARVTNVVKLSDKFSDHAFVLCRLVCILAKCRIDNILRRYQPLAFVEAACADGTTTSGGTA